MPRLSAQTAVALLVYLLFGGVGLAYFGGAAIERRHRLDEEGRATGGRIVRCWGGRGAGCRYEFEAGGRLFAGETGAEHRPGAPVDVLYLPTDPEANDTADSRKATMGALLATLGGAQLVAAGVLTLARRRRVG